MVVEYTSDLENKVAIQLTIMFIMFAIFTIIVTLCFIEIFCFCCSTTKEIIGYNSIKRKIKETCFSCNLRKPLCFSCNLRKTCSCFSCKYGDYEYKILYDEVDENNILRLLEETDEIYV